MRKIISTLIILSLCLSNLIYVHASEQQYVFSVSDAVIEYTQEGNVSVSVRENAGFASFILEVAYDTDFLELISSKKSISSDVVYNNGNIVINDTTAGKIKIVFASQENVTAENISLVGLTFKAINVPINNDGTLVELDVTFLDDSNWSNDVLTDSSISKNGMVNIQLETDVTIYNVSFTDNSGSEGEAPKTITTDFKETITLPDNTFTREGYKFAGWLTEVDGEKIFLPEGAEYTVTSDVEFEAVWIDIDMQIGASVRTASPTGLRFYTRVDTDSYNTIKAIDTNAKCGTFISPFDYFTDGIYTMEWLTENNRSYLDIENVAFAEENILYKEYRGVISNIMTKNYNRLFVGRGYIQFSYTNGEKNTIYTDFTQEDNARAVAAVAKKALEDTTANYTDEQKSVLKQFAESYKEE